MPEHLTKQWTTRTFKNSFLRYSQVADSKLSRPFKRRKRARILALTGKHTRSDHFKSDVPLKTDYRMRKI